MRPHTPRPDRVAAHYVPLVMSAFLGVARKQTRRSSLVALVAVGVLAAVVMMVRQTRSND